MARAMRSYAMLLAMPFLLGAIFCLALIVWDPLDLRPWGEPVKLAERPYPMLVRPLLAATLTHNAKSVVLIGTSTAIAISDQQLNRLEDRKGAANLSVVMQRAPDGIMAMHEAVRTPALRRIVIEVSHIWLYGAEASGEPGRRLDRAYHPRWYDLPAFDREIIRAGLAARIDRRFWIPEWEEQTARFRPSMQVELLPAQLGDVRRALYAATPADFSPGPTPADCSGFGALSAALADTLAVARERNIAVDVYFSPIPFASLPLMATQQADFFAAYGIKEPFFAPLMAMHRCVVGQVAAQGSPKMVVHALDADPAIVGDLRGMRDPLHYSMAFKNDLIIDDIGARQMILTPENFEAYRDRLRQGILAAIDYGVPPSAPPAPADTIGG